MAWQFDSGRPIYTQLLERIRLSVRDLAAEAAVNPNTMQRALAELERMGLVYSQRTSGRTITEDRELIQRIKEGIAVQHIEGFLVTMKQLGYTKEEIIRLMEEKNS